MLKAATRAEAGKDALKAALSRPPVVAAVDLGASKVTCFIMKPDGVHRGDRTLTAAGVGYVQSRGVRGAVTRCSRVSAASRSGRGMACAFAMK